MLELALFIGGWIFYVLVLIAVLMCLLIACWYAGQWLLRYRKRLALARSVRRDIGMLNHRKGMDGLREAGRETR